MEKYDVKMRKLYEKAIYYEKEFFSKLRINGEQGYITFCKFQCLDIAKYNCSKI